MSIESWKNEFYPVPANQVVEADALKHSHTKWLGLLPSNLQRHGMEKHLDERHIGEIGQSSYYYDPTAFRVNDESCALCQHYYDDACRDCPLYLVSGKTCDFYPVDGKLSPYDTWKETNNPVPMIRLIERAMRKTKISPPKSTSNWKIFRLEKGKAPLLLATRSTRSDARMILSTIRNPLFKYRISR